jgi:MFS transporter, DHA1 family, multidrug resistance protein
LSPGAPTRRIRPDQIRLLLPLGMAVSLSLAGDSTLYAVLANQVEVVGISLAGVGVLLGANRLIRIPANPLAGLLNDRWGRRRLFLLGMFLGMLSTLAYGWAYGFWPLLAARLLWGTAWALINVGGYIMVLDRSTSADRGRMTGFYQISYMLGLSLSPIIGGALTDALGFRPAVRICALITGFGFVIALLFLPETRPQELGQQLDRNGHRSRPSVARLFGMVQRMDRQMWAVAFLSLSIFLVSNGVLMSTISLYLAQRWGTSISLGSLTVGVSSVAGAMLSMRAALGVVSGPVAGTVSDRLRDRWPVVVVAILIALSGFAILTQPVSVLLAFAAVMLVASGAGALIAVLAALVGDRVAGDRPGVAMGALATAGDIGSAIGPLVGYALAVRLDLRWVYLLCAAILGAGLAIALRQGQGQQGSAAL